MLRERNGHLNNYLTDPAAWRPGHPAQRRLFWLCSGTGTASRFSGGGSASRRFGPASPSLKTTQGLIWNMEILHSLLIPPYIHFDQVLSLINNIGREIFLSKIIRKLLKGHFNASSFSYENDFFFFLIFLFINKNWNNNNSRSLICF